MDRPRTAGTWLVDQLRQAIIEGELPAGSAIKQEELAATYGVSRMPVRQALDILAVEGWIVQRPHRGAVVAALDPDDARELFDLRAAVEAVAIERSFPRLSDEQISNIRSAWQALREGGDDLPILHQQFHLALCAAAGPRLLRVVMQQLDAAQRYLRFEASALRVSDVDDQEHCELVAAAEARDAARGLKVLREHVGGGGLGIERSLRERGLGKIKD